MFGEGLELDYEAYTNSFTEALFSVYASEA